MENGGILAEADMTLKICMLRPFGTNPLKEFPGYSFPKRVKKWKKYFLDGDADEKKIDSLCPTSNVDPR